MITAKRHLIRLHTEQARKSSELGSRTAGVSQFTIQEAAMIQNEEVEAEVASRA